MQIKTATEQVYFARSMTSQNVAAYKSEAQPARSFRGLLFLSGCYARLLMKRSVLYKPSHVPINELDTSSCTNNCHVVALHLGGPHPSLDLDPHLQSHTWQSVHLDPDLNVDAADRTCRYLLAAARACLVPCKHSDHAQESGVTRASAAPAMFQIVAAYRM